MPAVYRKMSSFVPSAQRTNVIEDVETGDQIDMRDVLGRDAKRVKIIPESDAVTIELRLNNKIKIPTYHNLPGDARNGQRSGTVEVVSAGAQYPVYSLTGSTQYYTEEGLDIAFIDVVSNSGDPLTIYCW